MADDARKGLGPVGNGVKRGKAGAAIDQPVLGIEQGQGDRACRNAFDEPGDRLDAVSRDEAADGHRNVGLEACDHGVRDPFSGVDDAPCGGRIMRDQASKPCGRLPSF